MATPTRPVAAAPVATDWGQKVHDLTFVPPGTLATSGSLTGIATTLIKAALTSGQNLSTGDFLVPTGGEGVYLMMASFNVSTVGGAGNWRVAIYKNGVALITSNYSKIDSAGGGAMVVAMAALAAGDRIAIYTSGGAGTSGAAGVATLHAAKIAESFS